MSTDKAVYCPTCGSSLIESSPIMGTAKCQTCQWSGKIDALYDVPFTHSFDGREGVGDELANDMRRLMGAATFMTDFVRFLSRWGFVSLEGEKKTVANRVALYASAAARAVIQSIIATRTNQEQDKIRGTVAAPKG